MAATKAAISSVRVTMPSCAASIADWVWDSFRSKAFFLSSELSNSVRQYCFLLSSATCSSFNKATISSIILITFPNPDEVIFFPVSANARNSNRARPRGDCCAAFLTKARAFACIDWALTLTCTKLELALGRVFLKSSNASSSLRILIVSAKASSSSERVLERSSHSCVLVAQLFSKSARNFLSSNNAASVSGKIIFHVHYGHSQISDLFDL